MIGASEPQISNWIRGKNGPSPDFGFAVEKVTAKEVTYQQMQEWMKQHSDPPQASRKKRVPRLAFAS